MKRKPYKISLDPGLGGTGWTLWEGEADLWKQLRPPVRAGVISVRGPEWEIRAREVAKALKPLLSQVDEVIVEFPEFFNDPKGHMAVAKGDLFKLTFLIGVISGAAWDYGARVTPVEVTKWKGQLSKRVVNDRIERLLKEGTSVLSTKHSHDWDACGIGLFEKGHF